MSKIIKEGELPVKRVKCDYCGCEFEYDKRDLIKERCLNGSPLCRWRQGVPLKGSMRCVAPSIFVFLAMR